MKHLIIILFLTITSNVLGQSEYKWINIPYLSNNISEYPYIDEYLNLHGSVKNLKQFVGHNNLLPLGRDLNLEFDIEGKVISVQSFISDIFIDELSSFTFYEFEYDSKGNIKNEMKTHVDKGDTIYLKKTNDVSWFSHISPEPVKVNAQGNSFIYTSDGDTTFSFYDSHGRKILDSIPDSGHTMTHNLTYTYYQDSIVVKVVFDSWREGNHIISYKLDRHGNWIEKRVTYESDLLFPRSYRRQITYYE